MADLANRIAGNIGRVIVGKPEVVRIALITLLADGHLLVEDVPGVGKTTLAKALARTIDCSVSRVQFTPDLLPGDITGMSIYNRQTSEFEFRPGPVFANIVIADEINRASPKTQSALLESMAERQVTVDGNTYTLASPFMVVATQNPIEMDGTYPLPEAQRDRFTCRVSVGYPDAAAELAMVDEHPATDPLRTLRPVTDGRRVARRRRDGAPRPHEHRGAAVLRRARRRHPPACPTCASAPRRGPPCSSCAPPGPRRRSPAAGTSSPTTCRPSPCPCWPTGCCSPPTRWPPAARPPTSSARSSADRRSRRPAGRADRGPHVRGTHVARHRVGGPRSMAVAQRTRLTGLTTRGRCLVAGGFATAACGFVLDERDLLRIGVFVGAAPGARAAVRRPRAAGDGASCGSSTRRGCPSASDAAVVLALRGPALVGALRLVDTVPDAAGPFPEAPPRFTVHRLSARGACPAALPRPARSCAACTGSAR